jgi:hypothetical protein
MCGYRVFKMPYQRVLVNGVPFWKESGILYAYEPNPTPETVLRMGTELGLDADWQEVYEARLAEYRDTIKARAR